MRGNKAPPPVKPVAAMLTPVDKARARSASDFVAEAVADPKRLVEMFALEGLANTPNS